MKEVTFIRRNIEKWKETEKVVERAASLSPDQLADAYTDLTADLAFAQTHFPTSRITIYLNNLASALHNEIYRNKRKKCETQAKASFSHTFRKVEGNLSEIHIFHTDRGNEFKNETIEELLETFHIEANSRFSPERSLMKS